MQLRCLRPYILNKLAIGHIIRTNDQTLLELLRQKFIRSLIGAKIIRLLGNLGPNLSIQDKIQESMGIIAVRRLGRDKCRIHPKTKPFLRINHLQIGILAQGKHHLGSKQKRRAYFPAKQKVLGLVLAQHPYIRRQLHQLIPGCLDNLQILRIKRLSHGF